MLEPLLAELNSPSDTVRDAALQKARNLPPDQLLRLMRLAAHKNLLRPAANLVALKDRWRSLLPNIKGYFTVLISGNIRAWGHVPASLFGTPAQRSFAALIADLEDLRFLGVVLILLGQSEYNTFVRANAHTALKKMLPQMRVEHADELTYSQGQVLLQLLKQPYFDHELTLCILKALEQFGDEGAIPAVSRIASLMHAQEDLLTYSRRISSPIGFSTIGFAPETAVQVYQAARSCLEQLKLHAAATQQAQMLLRASDSVADVEPDTFLRPAAFSASEIPPEEMLRPAHTEETPAE
jgi:hypothetical protein